MNDRTGEPAICEHLLLGVTGSLTALTMPHYVFLMRQTLARRVTVMMSEAATRYLPAYTMRLFANSPVYTDTNEIVDGVRVPHIELTEACDLFLIMPATANIIAKAAVGIADDLISTSIVACPAPVVMVPTMNGRMWESPVVRRNVRWARELGYHIIEPGHGYQLADMEPTLGVMPPLEFIIDDLRAIATGNGVATEKGVAGRG